MIHQVSGELLLVFFSQRFFVPIFGVLLTLEDDYSMCCMRRCSFLLWLLMRVVFMVEA
jgi:hypothetical protein